MLSIFTFSEIPLCLPTAECTWATAEVISRSLMEEFSTTYDESWHITVDPYRYIQLRFHSFHIECNIQSSLVIALTNGISRAFCNTNKPVEGVKSVNNKLTINFRTVNHINRIPVGFSSTYEARSKNLPMNTTGTQKWNGDYFQLACFRFIIY